MNVGRGLLALLFSTVAPAPQSVGSAEILAAIERSQGFDPTATTNGARFQAEVLLVLARDRRARDPLGLPLLIGHAEWFSAFLARTGLTREKAPAFVRLAYEHKQDMEVEYRSERVLQEVVEGPRPRLALNVRIWWPERRDASSSYSYEDMLSTPHLKVTNKRVMSYRLLEFEDMLVFADVEASWAARRRGCSASSSRSSARGTSKRTVWRSPATVCRSRMRGLARPSSV